MLTPNITSDTLFGLFLWASLATLFFPQQQRGRMVCWVFVWMFWSPVRETGIDTIMMLTGWIILERSYKKLRFV